jgi:gamma-tubulin complex component 5
VTARAWTWRDWEPGPSPRRSVECALHEFHFTKVTCGASSGSRLRQGRRVPKWGRHGAWQAPRITALMPVTFTTHASTAMAQNAKLSGLTDELIHSILGFDPLTSKQAYKHAKDIASRGLRGHQYARTNQFDVVSAFAGLDEKFRVKNRDDLADALQVRLQKLDGVKSRFTPDFLSLLLQLSDRPLENTRVDALDLLRPPSPPLPLTWDEILGADPYSDEDIWKDIDYAAGSSGDEKVVKKRVKPKPSPPTSVNDYDTYDPEACVVAVEMDPVQELKAAQFWNVVADDKKQQAHITELQAVRETLFMLAGLPTSMYHLDEQQSNIHMNSHYELSHARPETVEHLLAKLIAVGRDLYRLRRWTRRSSTLPLVQTFEAAVRTRLLVHDRALAQLQQKYLTPQTPIAVSLLQLHLDVRSMSAPVLCLAQLVLGIEPELLVNPFSHLETLFNQITLAQMTLEAGNFHFLSCVFFDCLQTYLKPIRQWMQAGELGSNDETFFVFQSNTGSDVTSLWHDRYVLRRDAHDNLRCPAFLHPAAKKIFNTGKSVVFLKEIELRNARATSTHGEPLLDHTTVCGPSDEVPLLPYPELFQAAFENWMESKYSQASSVLRQYLVEQAGLMRILNIFEMLYLGRNGAVFEDFANALFSRMDAGRKGWNDRYVLTEITRGIFATAMPVAEAEKIVVRSTKIKRTRRSVKNLATVSLDFALPWPIQNIIQRASISIYQQMFTFLMQTYRVKYIIQRVPLMRNTHNDKSAASQLIRKLKHRLIWFVEILRSYLTETAIFFTTRQMVASMDKAEDIDEMSHVHLQYVSKLQSRALLSKDIQPIHKAIIEILDLGVLFAERIENGNTTRPGGPVVSRTTSIWQKTSTLPSTAAELSDSDAGGDVQGEHPVKQQPDVQSLIGVLTKVDKEFVRLLPFVIAGLRSVGRVGAEPMWEQLAERLDWRDKKQNT